MQLNEKYITTNDTLDLAKATKPYKSVYTILNNLVVRTPHALVYKSGVSVAKQHLITILDKFIKSAPDIDGNDLTIIEAIQALLKSEKITRAVINTSYVKANKDAERVIFYSLFLDKDDAVRAAAVLKENIPSIADGLNKNLYSLKALAQTLNSFITMKQDKTLTQREQLVKELSDELNRLYNIRRTEKIKKPKVTEDGLVKEKSVKFAEKLINQEAIDIDEIRKTAISYQTDIDNIQDKKWKTIVLLSETEAKVGFIIVPETSKYKEQIKNYIKEIFKVVPPEHSNILVTKYNQKEQTRLNGFVVPILGKVSVQNAYPMFLHLAEPKKAEQIQNGGAQ